MVELTADVKAIESMIINAEYLDIVFISAGRAPVTGTLSTDTAAWDSMFEQLVKAPNFLVAKALPLLRRSKQPKVVMVAQAPVCHPDSFVAPAVPCAVISQMRGMYVTGMAAEFGGSIRVNAVWGAGTTCNPPAIACLDMLVCTGLGTGHSTRWNQALCPHHKRCVAC